MALSKNKRQVDHTCPLVLDLRDQFDIYQDSRTKLWGGAYPRPAVEMTEKSWKLSEIARMRGHQIGVKVLLDPDVDYSTYSKAL
jgi:hypothetical protein